MSILVRDMKMPKDGCRDCVFVNQKWHGDICSILKKEVTGNVERGGFQTDCPLIPIPSHGRMIDADALLNLLNNCMFPSDMVTTMAVRMATNWIKEAPTILEAEEE